MCELRSADCQMNALKCRPPSIYLELEHISTCSIFERKSTVNIDTFRPLAEPGSTVAELRDSLPDILAGRNIKALVAKIVSARRKGCHWVIAYGGHVIKCGCGPVLVDLMKRGFLTALAMNGAAAIHDYELAYAGQTSEDVQEGLGTGRFGMARGTARTFQLAAEASVQEGIGFGQALGQQILRSNCRYSGSSPLAIASEMGIPATVHIAIGADVVHMHPNAAPGQTGQASHRDFRLLAGVVSQLNGGVWMNVGSAVFLPEVFLKALTVARNLKYTVDDFLTANFDIILHHRPRVNLLERPGGKGFAITGHHEIMLPLLRTGVLAAWPTGQSH